MDKAIYSTSYHNNSNNNAFHSTIYNIQKVSIDGTHNNNYNNNNNNNAVLEHQLQYTKVLTTVKPL